MADANSIAMDPSVKDLTGQRFGRLTVVRYAGSKDGNAQWLCQCDCGATTLVAGSNLRKHTRSCGCLVSERMRDRNKTHGKSRTPEYDRWAQMIQRCYNPRCSNYSKYGGRGITVCERWRESFEAFLEDMGPRPTGRRISIERIDNAGHYEPGNCKWATPKEQNNNKGDTVRVTFRGKTRSLSAWAEECGVPLERLRQRLKSGWSVERALAEPIGHCRASASSATPSL